MAKEQRYIDAPRIQVVLVPKGNPNVETTPFELWLVLHVPDGKPPQTTRLATCRNRDDAIHRLLEVYTTIGEAHAFEGTPGVKPQGTQ